MRISVRYFSHSTLYFKSSIYESRSLEQFRTRAKLIAQLKLPGLHFHHLDWIHRREEEENKGGESLKQDQEGGFFLNSSASVINLIIT